ncbi:phytanoyl-CoA dioxygenase domain-containing protein 1 homolog [Ctenocephalides felis]|uniref:phytanoyl-CoA dioxygenase domain-containing protein 1 homolog n=1 Tax=Ctenocephalides felis TaxID=7515 RepID=UPI000E6E3466|nr:phytanoyl-CoA dioxygenase domain-containing protein 1 homolog [Ctenocephalides felis]
MMREGLAHTLETDGYVVLEDFFTAQEVEEMKNAGDDLTKNIPEDCRSVFSTINHKDKQSKDKYFIESGDQIRYFFEEDALDKDGNLIVDQSKSLNKVGHALHWFHPTFNKHTYSNKIRELFWQLGFKAPAVVQSMYIYKNPGIGSEVVAHQDATFLKAEPPSALVGIWIALEDATPETGCLRFAKGSHKSGVHRRYKRTKNGDDVVLEYDRPAPLYPANNFVECPVKKGTCIVIHGLVVHDSKPNRSTRSRHAYTFHVLDAQDGVDYSKDNWLQPTERLPFQKLYERND